MNASSPDSNAPLYKLWYRNTGNRNVNTIIPPQEWLEQVYQLSLLGRAMEETLAYLCTPNVSYETFTGWLQKTTPQQLNASYDEAILTDEDMDFWDQNGYIVVKDIIPQSDCEAVRNAIWEFTGMAPDKPQSWYGEYNGRNGMMLNFFHHPALDAVRNSPKILRVYQQLYRSNDIYMLIDKVSFNPPENRDFNFTGSPLHWDVSLELPIPYALQGLVYLNDVAAEDGAFHCVPGFHKQIGAWLNSLPPDAMPRDIAIKELTPVAISGNTGDLVIWNQALPHCATPNKGVMPRMVQYVAYKPVNQTMHEKWK